MPNKKSMKKMLLAIGIVILFLITYYNDTMYEKLIQFSPHPYLIKLIDNAVNEVDIVKKINQKNLPNEAYIDLILSGDDLKDLQNKMKTFMNHGFIVDQDNNWRKAKALINGEKHKIKYKVHGTSVTSMKMGLTPWETRQYLYSGGGKPHPSIDSGSFSLKVKHKKDSDYLNLMRRYNLISSYDEDPELSTIALNQIAEKLGLISPHGRMIILRINNTEIGAYMLVENHGKEWLERNHQLTNYTIIKSNDDWTRKEGGHSSGADLYIQNKEIKTTSLNYSKALGALEFLLNSIKNRDIDKIKKIIDMRYMAKYMALLSITNDTHSVAGDNLRYIYDHSTGLFKLLFRIESSVSPHNNNTVEDFNRLKGFDSDTHKLFKILLTDSDFLQNRDQELFNITNSYDEYLEIANKVFDENMDVLYASKEPIRPIIYKIKRFKNNFLNNIENAKMYLNYNKVFVTKYTDTNGRKSLNIVNDFNHKLTLKSIERKDGNKIITEKVNFLIAPLSLDKNLNLIYKTQKIDINTRGIYKLFFENSITGEVIEQKHIYINEAVEFPYLSQNQALKTLDVNNIDYTTDLKAKNIIIETGVYSLTDDVIMPYGFSLSIEPGTEMLLGAGVSFLGRGSAQIKGKKDMPIKINRLNPDSPFGSFAIMGNGIDKTTVDIRHLIVDGGSQATIHGVSFSGQFSIHKANVFINSSTFMNSLSDDGINIKHSKVDIQNSEFMNNFGDQIDLDFCNANVLGNIFSYENPKFLNSISTDGLDVSGSIVESRNNSFRNFSDKGISIGEQSTIFIEGNIFNGNNLAISVKDGSNAIIGANKFDANVIDISQYIKKKFYSKPTTYSINENKALIQDIKDGIVSYISQHDLKRRFMALQGLM